MKIIKELSIIGAGPAGMAAAIDAENSRIDFILIEKSEPGWYAKYSINQHYKVDGYLGFYNSSGDNLVNSFMEHIKSKNIEIKNTEIEAVKYENEMFHLSCDNGDEIISKYVIIASGTIPRKLYIDGYEELINKSIFNFVCAGDIDFYNKKIYVLGGRNSGVTTALFLSDNSDSEITIIEKDKQLNATDKYLERLAKTNVRALVDSEVVGVVNGDKLKEIIIRTGSKVYSEEADLIFCCIGTKPNFKFVELELQTDSSNRIIVDPLTMETSFKGLYAIGDINQLLPKQVCNAAANGKTAVYFINKELQKERKSL